MAIGYATVLISVCRVMEKPFSSTSDGGRYSMTSPRSLPDWFAGKGFDVERLRFGLQTALTACLALALAWILGLEHPQWSAMTVWAASQPLRQQLIAKSLYRMLGTVIGTGVGLMLLMAAGDHLIWLVVGLSLWVGLCAAVGNALYSLLSYATLLSGYSAAMVALLGMSASMSVTELGIDRLLTVLLGVVMAMLVGLVFTPKASSSELIMRGRRLTSGVLHQLVARLDGIYDDEPRDPNKLAVGIASLEVKLETVAIGLRKASHSARSQRAILSALIAILLWLRRGRLSRLPGPQTRDAVREAAVAMDRGAPPAEVAAAVQRASDLATDTTPALADALGRLAHALRERQYFRDTGRIRLENDRRHIIRHRDWIHVRQVMLRTTGVLLIVGLCWIASGWSAGAYVMLGTSVKVTLFSTFENPAWIMRRIFAWQSVGGTCAVVLQALVWPLAGYEWVLVLSMLPFILLTVIPFSHRRTQSGSMDVVMIFLLLSQPDLPLTATFAESLTKALAVVAGPLLALLAFRTIYPTDARRRQQQLHRMMTRELVALAGKDSREGLRFWQARFYHRVMRLLYWAHLRGLPTHQFLDGSLAALILGQALQALQQYRLSADVDPGTARRVEAVLRRVGDLQTHPRQAARALERLADTLERRQHLELARLTRHAARELQRHQAFFVSEADPAEALPAS
ncbi:FUSC family protein [Halomonas sp. 22501_18_FS]|uniref:FUSC family protein n=2 Tax=Oceanospirillales TaxID=135619 RepID=A0A9X4YE83_9GAMM|nr:FUSC family protein [Halomonas utahensis]MYL74982.1 FUSC family protein [Halomonas sp. 22501_18_FS]